MRGLTKLLPGLALTFTCLAASALDNKDVVVCGNGDSSTYRLVVDGCPPCILRDSADLKGIGIALNNLGSDFCSVTGNDPAIAHWTVGSSQPNVVIVGSIESAPIKKLVKDKKIDARDLKGRNEKYLMTVVGNPLPGVAEALVIAGSDRRGTIYGIYELSEMIGVSPWTFWADVPVIRQDNIAIKRGTYTAGEPRVKYRGIFLNDEAPCLTSWVKNTYGTGYGDNRFYGKVCELILRLRGNFLWPAMWSWAFYADDDLNACVADEMGVIVGTSHHEPMARNHQEYARRRGHYGPWNYNTNSEKLDQFFKEGIDRMQNRETVVTIGMRGDGDEAMSEDADVALLQRIIRNQRDIIAKATGKKASETPQVWALYKEVLDYYDKGLRAPDDVIYLLCDDNWGNLRRVPSSDELKHPGGFGLYYHVDYVGAPRNSKFLNVTPVEGMWEQLTLAARSGIDRLWILNVGDLKPMEYPITLFLDMAWNPGAVDYAGLHRHTVDFCAAQFGADNAAEAARILNLYSKYNGRVTPEMLDHRTYNLATGEWQRVADDYRRLELRALRQYIDLDPCYRDAYAELILFPVQVMANLYDMYFAQAMNLALAASNDPEANVWADRVKECFDRDAELMTWYNKEIAGGKWDGMMTQKHIGYKGWNDDFAHTDVMPRVKRVDSADPGNDGYTFAEKDGVVSIEAPHFHDTVAPSCACWQVLEGMGRTLGGVAVMPYDAPVDGACLHYVMETATPVDSVTVHVIVKSTLDYRNTGGHRYRVSIDGCEPVEVNFNHNLNENPENVYTVFYPTVARRQVEKTVSLPIEGIGEHTLSLEPLDPGIVFEKLIVDLGGYTPTYLGMAESPHRRR